MNKNIFITIIVAGASLAMSCNSGNVRRNPGKTYVPDMTYSRAYDAYSAMGDDSMVTPVSTESLKPVKGTIARGHALPTHLEEKDSIAYYAMTSPYKFTELELSEGQRKYDIYCGICHGQKLDGEGPLYTSGKFAAMPANLMGDAYKSMSQGKMYYAIMYGKGMMGSYSSQLSENERWAIVAYIKKVQSENGGAPFTLLAEKKEAVQAVAEEGVVAPH